MTEQYHYLMTIQTEDRKTLYLVEDTINKRIVVQAVIKNGNEQLYRQLQELNLPNIPHIYEIQTKGHYLHVYEEFIQYPTLEKYRKTHPISEKEAIDIMQQLLGILNILHHQNPPIIHRDIKPENIFYNDHKVILTDFDIARTHASASKDKDTTVLGSVGYASPEQFGFNETDITSDIYSCGILFNVLLTGDFPMVKKASGKLGQIITKATMIAPKDRYQDVQKFMKDLDDYVQHPIFSFIQKYRKKLIMHLIFFSAVTALLIWSFVTDSSSSNNTLTQTIVSTLFYYYMFYLGLWIYLKRDYFNRFSFYRKGKAVRHFLFGCFVYLVVMMISLKIFVVLFP